MTDMYYYLKDKLSCCDWPLTYSYDIGYMCYMAKCPVCGTQYQVNVETINRGKEMTLKADNCDCNDLGCEKCCCEDCGGWLFSWEESKCEDCIENEEREFEI